MKKSKNIFRIIILLLMSIYVFKWIKDTEKYTEVGYYSGVVLSHHMATYRGEQNRLLVEWEHGYIEAVPVSTTAIMLYKKGDRYNTELKRSAFGLGGYAYVPYDPECPSLLESVIVSLMGCVALVGLSLYLIFFIIKFILTIEDKTNSSEC